MRLAYTMIEGDDKYVQNVNLGTLQEDITWEINIYI